MPLFPTCAQPPVSTSLIRMVHALPKKGPRLTHHHWDCNTAWSFLKLAFYGFGQISSEIYVYIYISLYTLYIVP